MKTLAIDPGCTESQLLAWDGKSVTANEYLANADMLASLRRHVDAETSVCIEMVASYGMPVGREVFDTCVWIGRFFERVESFKTTPALVFRQEVKLHLCNSARAKDGNIRQALIDRFGGKEKAVGRKTTPGPLYGVSSHAWAALALAITFSERRPA